MIVTLGLLSPNDEKILSNAIKYLIDEHKKIQMNGLIKLKVL